MSATDDQDGELALEDGLDMTREAWLNEVHTSFPARVERYDRAAQKADLVPMVRRSLPRADGGRAVETLPILRAVRVGWVRAGRWFVHAPLAAGDFVMVHCCERDFSAWAQTGSAGDPIDVRTQHLQHAIAVPTAIYPEGQALADVPADAMVIGKDGGATIRIKDSGEIDIGTAAANFVALANLVKARLDTIQSAFDAHTHVGTATVSTGPVGTIAPPTSPIGPLADVAASKVKAE